MGFRIMHGDCVDLLSDIPDVSIDLVFFDPPWNDEDCRQLWVVVARAANRILKPGGNLIGYCGQNSIPQVTASMTALASSEPDWQLRFWWLCYVSQKGSRARLPGKWIKVAGKPLLWYLQGGRRDRRWVLDCCSIAKHADKGRHQWAQHPEVAEQFIGSLTHPGDVVLDPCCGSGSTGVAALRYGCEFIGMDIELQSCVVTAERLREYAETIGGDVAC